MVKKKITVSLNSEVADRLRTESIKKYGNARCLSRLIEDLVTGAAIEEPKACSILGHRSGYSFESENEFDGFVEEATTQLSKIEPARQIKNTQLPINGPELYFVLKEACELRLNTIAAHANKCPSCHGLDAPLPTFPDAGKNFKLYATLDSRLR